MKIMESIRTDLPNVVTALPGPNARAVIGRDSAVLSPSYTRSYPLVVRRGQGAIIEDVDGNRFLDFTAGIAVVSTGHCHPRVVEAIQKQAAELIHMSGTDFYYENMVALAEKLVALAPGEAPKRVYFGNSGTEAIEAALKMARYHTGRGQFIAFFGAFHGRTMGSLALTGSKSVQKKGFFPVMQGVASRSLCLLLSLRVWKDAGLLRGGMREGDRRAAFPADGSRRRGRGDFHRAGAGRRRLCGPAEKVF